MKKDVRFCDLGFLKQSYHSVWDKVCILTSEIIGNYLDIIFNKFLFDIR